MTAKVRRGALEQEIVKALNIHGPLSGSELFKLIRGNNILVWRTCLTSKKLQVKTIGTRYLRLDRHVEGIARLSPSILREFLTYSVVGLRTQARANAEKAGRLLSHVKKVSRSKLELARSFTGSIISQSGDAWPGEKICLVLAGDIVYDMAHDVPRPERSTGRMVSGSDIDLVVLLDDSVPDDQVRELDQVIYREKYRTLISPAFKEEIDYVVKKMSKVREQVRFDTFKDMVACKILDEGVLIGGSKTLHRKALGLLKKHGVPCKLEKMKQAAARFRKKEEKFLLQCDVDKISREDLYFFYSKDESDEFERGVY